MDCVFCKIINDEIPKRVIYSDDVCEVIMDAFPSTEGHVLVVLKEHVESLSKASDEQVMHVAKVVKLISNTMEVALRPDGITTFENRGLLQEIPHAHVHIMPTYENQRGIEFTTKADTDRIEIEYQKILSHIL